MSRIFTKCKEKICPHRQHLIICNMADVRPLQICNVFISEVTHQMIDLLLNTNNNSTTELYHMY